MDCRSPVANKPMTQFDVSYFLISTLDFKIKEKAECISVRTQKDGHVSNFRRASQLESIFNFKERLPSGFSVELIALFCKAVPFNFFFQERCKKQNVSLQSVGSFNPSGNPL